MIAQGNYILPAMTPVDSRDLVMADRVRHFNRIYTRTVGALQETLLGSEFSLTELRVLYELQVRGTAQASELCRDLGLNAGYLSRLLARLEQLGLVEKRRSSRDARSKALALTPHGVNTLQPYEDASRAEVMAMLAPLSAAQRESLVAAMERIEHLLAGPPRGYVLRDPRPGDMGWVVCRQARLYADEYGWNSEFEALLAEIVSRYLRDHDPASDRCWIAEQDGVVVGSVFVVRQDAETAKLRMLYVDALARGSGIGRRLVEESLGFARAAGYKRMVLWTNKALADAVRLYEKAGFTLVEEELHHAFGKDQTSQVWERQL
ncbi:helix-turn-helix domain-containing GNAT family N-acetyltransferase [Paracidovorax citrulli]